MPAGLTYYMYILPGLSITLYSSEYAPFAEAVTSGRIINSVM